MTSMFFCARLVKPEHRATHPNPLCGILGLPVEGKMWLGDPASLPVVGGPREFIAPAEWQTREAAELDIAQNRDLGLAFDWPVPADAVRWQLMLYHHYDGSSGYAARDIAWTKFRLYWLAALALSHQNPQLKVEVMSRLDLGAAGLQLPSGYSADGCGEFSALYGPAKPGAVDVMLSLLEIRPP